MTRATCELRRAPEDSSASPSNCAGGLVNIQILTQARHFLQPLLARPYFIVHPEEAHQAQRVLPYAMVRTGEADDERWVPLNRQLQPLVPCDERAANVQSEDLIYLYSDDSHPLVSPAHGRAYLELLLALSTSARKAA